ncbi:MAG: DUF1153 domain-containing protein [Caulobacter sp.]|nr:DUF1153 domain-containing protein [Caulobacter sp.]
MTLALGTRARLALGPITFWNPHRKLKVLKALDAADADGRTALMAEHGLTDDEVTHWRAAFDRHGITGLATRRQENRR